MGTYKHEPPTHTEDGVMIVNVPQEQAECIKASSAEYRAEEDERRKKWADQKREIFRKFTSPKRGW